MLVDTTPMKKFSRVLISLVLCSALVTGCITPQTPSSKVEKIVAVCKASALVGVSETLRADPLTRDRIIMVRDELATLSHSDTISTANVIELLGHFPNAGRAAEAVGAATIVITAITGQPTEVRNELQKASEALVEGMNLGLATVPAPPIILVPVTDTPAPRPL